MSGTPSRVLANDVTPRVDPEGPLAVAQVRRVRPERLEVLADILIQHAPPRSARRVLERRGKHVRGARDGARYEVGRSEVRGCEGRRCESEK